MLRVRLKADGRLVQILADGSEGGPPPGAEHANGRFYDRRPRGGEETPAYARRVRAATQLTQAEFAARLGVPIDTVRNWEQGKRAPRGPARALLKLIDKAPDLVFATLGADRTAG
jgi:putative transcriptional regulator